MSHDAWIRAEFAANPSKTQAGLAAALGLDRSQVTRLLKAAREIKARELPLIAAYFGTSVPTEEELAIYARGSVPASGRTRRNRRTAAGGFAEDAAAFAGPPGPALAPVFDICSDAPGEWLIMRHLEPVDRLPRAPHFENAARVFGFYAPDDSMAPRFRPGEIVWVDPARPAAPGEDAAAVQRGRADAPARIVLGELRSRTAREAVLHQYKERKDRRLPAAAWALMRVLPRY